MLRVRETQHEGGGVPLWEFKLHGWQMPALGAAVIFLNPCFPTLGRGLQESFVLARMALSSRVPFLTISCPLLGVSGKPKPLLAIVWDWRLVLSSAS